MAASSEVLKLIVKECCLPLSYNDEERQFSFPLKPSLGTVWERDRHKIRSIESDFVLRDFNAVLSTLESAVNSFEAYHLTAMSDEEIVNGEVLRIEIEGKDSPLRLIKMGRGQFLDVSTGSGLTLGDRFEFRVGKNVRSSEGECLGASKSMAILMPSVYNIVLGNVFLEKYYSNDIADSLWLIYDEAMKYLQIPEPSRLESIARIASDSGIGSFSLLNILKGVCALKN